MDTTRQTFDPWRHLAAAIVERAIDDAAGDHPARRRRAQSWLAGAGLVSFLAGTNAEPAAVRWRLRRRGLLPMD